MFGISGEHLLILSAVILIFGPKQLPALGHSIGRTIKNFKEGLGGPNSDNAQAPGDKPPPSIEVSVKNEKGAA